LTDVDPGHDARVRSKNRKALIGLTVLCLILGTLGFLFALWLLSLPSVAPPAGH
jgi:hypothetical protein